MLRDRSGFTLIELIIVLSILAILSSLTIPKYKKIIAYEKLDITAKQLVADLREGQQKALAQETNVQADFYRNINGTSTDVYILKILEKNGYKKYKSVTLPKDIQLVDARFGNNNMLCTFSTFGKPTFNGHIKLENKNGQNLFVIVYQTGRIRISKDQP